MAFGTTLPPSASDEGKEAIEGRQLVRVQVAVLPLDDAHDALPVREDAGHVQVPVVDENGAHGLGRPEKRMMLSIAKEGEIRPA